MPHLYAEIMRVRWLLLVAVGVQAARAVGVLPEAGGLTLLLHKASLTALGFLLAHVGYQQAFPYLKQRDLLQTARPPGPDTATAVCFLGVCLLRGLLYAACILGVTLGL